MSSELAGDGAVGGGPCASSLLVQHVNAHPGVSLERVLAVAQLTTRVELKYLLPLDFLPAVLHRLPHGLAALDIHGRRIFDYESVYFDTDGFVFYRHHVQGRRKRYKARTRSYCNSGDAMFEVKLKGRRGETVKERLPYDFQRRGELTGDGRAFLDAVITQAYGCTVPPVRAALTTTYRRVTLVDLERGSRLTIDVDLGWSDERSRHRAGRLVLVESKGLSGPGPVDLLLRSMGVRPVAVSKYCVGVALLNPDMAANRWNRLLVREFAWQRAAEPGVRKVC